MINKSGKSLQQIKSRLLALPAENRHHQLNPVVLPARVSSPRLFAPARGRFWTQNAIIEVGKTFDMRALKSNRRIWRRREAVRGGR